MKTTRLTATAAAVAVALTCTASAAAETADPEHFAVPAGAKIVNKPAKRLSLKAAARSRARARRTGRFPAPPRLRGVSLRDLATVSHGHHEEAPPASGAPEPAGSDRLFGSESPYYAKRDPILSHIQHFNAVNVPRNGGRYVPPALYQLQHGAQLPGCNGPVYNGAYCPAANTLGWSMSWTDEAFRYSGDMAWAMLISHEYGHAAQQFLGIRGGLMNKTIYSEAFADCMAGGFLYYAHASRITDGVGRGDYNEFRDAVYWLRSPSNDENTHGTYEWRYGSAVYGWNYGFDGCTRWARSVDGV